MRTYYTGNFNAFTLEYGLTYLHPELRGMLCRYQRIRDCLNNMVKAKGKEYLPDPSEVHEDPKVAKQRYEYYHQRAQWLPVTKRTQQGLVAQVFTHAPVVRKGAIPAAFFAAPSVQGDTLEGLANYGLGETVALGRGAFVTWFTAAGSPVIDFIEAENIITWSELPYGVSDALGRNMESITVRTFAMRTDVDGISVRMFAQLTQFKFDSNKNVYMRTSTESTSTAAAGWSTWTQLFINNKALDFIPVFLTGAERNILQVQTPPLEELSELNINHLINSADYGEHAKIAGQVTVVLKGLKQDWYTKNIEGKIAFGVRKPIPLNEGADAKLLQATANSVAKEALDKSEQMMSAIGARLIEQRQVRRTATEADIESQSYHSILGHIANNVSDALSRALVVVSMFYTEQTYEEHRNSVGIALNTDFSSINTSAEHRRLLLEEYIAGTRTFAEYRTALRKYDSTLTADDDTAKKEIEKDIVLREKLAKIGAQPAANSDNRTKPPTTE